MWTGSAAGRMVVLALFCDNVSNPPTVCVLSCSLLSPKNIDPVCASLVKKGITESLFLAQIMSSHSLSDLLLLSPLSS